MLARGNIDEGVARNGQDLDTRTVCTDVNHHRRVVAQAGNLVLVTRSDIAGGTVSRVRADNEDVDGASLEGVRGRLALIARHVGVDVDDAVGELGAQAQVEEPCCRGDEKDTCHQNGKCAAQEAKPSEVNS